VCKDNVCAEPAKDDGVKNGDESDVDCGGANAPPCSADKTCNAPGDCLSRNCVAGKCVASSDSDGVQNGNETGVDCGGPNAKPCAAGGGCVAATDCESKVCTGGKCAAASNTDGVKNGTETDVDCGGAGNPACGDGKGCAMGSDCVSLACNRNVCVPPSANDGIKNGSETGVDCGGPDAIPRCDTGGGCNAPTDCASQVCTGGTCRAPSPTDGVKNGTETDVDCGGAGNPKCGAGKVCTAHVDCASDGCSYDNRCASRRTCTRLPGGYTCGPNEGGGRQEDCCDTAAVGPYRISKYQITAGRMRTFVERLGGNVRAWAAGLPAAQWNQAWTPELPANIDEANVQLGPYYDKRACDSGYHTGHTYWTPNPLDARQDFPKDVNDTKALNCTPWWLTAAMCVWDGGHMVTSAELRAAYTNNNTTAYPWGAIGAYNTTGQVPHAVQHYSYATPSPPAGARTDAAGYLDIAFYIAPPGRRMTGYSATGVADLVGNLLEWVGDQDRRFVWKGSFERHSQEADNFTPGANDPYSALTTGGAPWVWGTNIGIGRPGDGRGVGYYGIGSRCAY
jgi:hypothetical protein